MTSTERGCAMMARADSASCAWLLCGALGPATPADAHHTKPHQEAVQAGVFPVEERAARRLDGLLMRLCMVRIGRRGRAERPAQKPRARCGNRPRPHGATALNTCHRS